MTQTGGMNLKKRCQANNKTQCICAEVRVMTVQVCCHQKGGNCWDMRYPPNSLHGLKF